jgi:hypothetical protein
MRARDCTQSSRGCNGEDTINATGDETDGNVQLADEIRGNVLFESKEKSTTANATGQRPPDPLNWEEGKGRYNRAPGDIL